MRGRTSSIYLGLGLVGRHVCSRCNLNSSDKFQPKLNTNHESIKQIVLIFALDQSHRSKVPPLGSMERIRRNIVSIATKNMNWECTIVIAFLSAKINVEIFLALLDITYAFLLIMILVIELAYIYIYLFFLHFQDKCRTIICSIYPTHLVID